MATTPDNTRCETIEAAVERVRMNACRHAGTYESSPFEFYPRGPVDDLLAALAPAEPQAREASAVAVAVAVSRMDTSRGADFFVEITCGGRSVTPHVFRERFKAEYEVAYLQWVFGLRADEPDLLAYDETAYPNEGPNVPHLTPRPAPAPAAETEGLVERLTRENDILRGLVANGPGDCVYCGLSRADMGKCQSGFPGCDRADDMACAPEPNTAQLGARTQPPADVTEALRWYFDMLEEQVHGHSAQSSIWWGKSVTFERHEQARRLLASTGSRQEPAGEPVGAERADALSAIFDWKAPYEVQPQLPDGSDAPFILAGLAREGMADYSRDQNTYRITNAGRAWLDQFVAQHAPAALRSQPASRVDENDAERLRREVSGVTQPASRDSGGAMREVTFDAERIAREITADTRRYREAHDAERTIRKMREALARAEIWLSTVEGSAEISKVVRAALPTSHSGSAS